MSKVMATGETPWGGSGTVFKKTLGGWFTPDGRVVVGVVVVGTVVAGGAVVVGLAAGVVVVSLLLLFEMATAVPAAAAAAIPSTAPVPIPPATNPAGKAGNTATVALLRNGAIGTSFLHSRSERTTIGAYSCVRPEFSDLSWPST